MRGLVLRVLFIVIGSVVGLAGCEPGDELPATGDGGGDGSMDGGEADALDVLSDAYMEGNIHLQARFCQCFYELAAHPDVDTCLAAQPEVSVSICETDALRTEPERYEAFLRCAIAGNERVSTCYEGCPASPDTCTPPGEPSECSSLLSASQIEAWQTCFS